jgi:hypothetical protein
MNNYFEKTYDTNITKNTHYYYNYILFKYFLKNYELNPIGINETIQKISSYQNKTQIEPYLKIYSHYLKLNISSFIDLGSAPGGFLKYCLNNNIKNGYGITLPNSEFGLGMKIKFDNIIYGDLLDDNFINSLKLPYVDFINMGAVSYGNEPKHQKLFINQLKIVKKFLNKNGSFMFVYDIFFSFINFVLIVNIFIKNNINVSIIPVQPNFDTTQVYIKVDNVTMTEKLFEQINNITTMPYIPISKKYNINLFKNILESKYFNLESFKEAFLIHVISKNKKIPIFNIDRLRIVTINFNYCRYNKLFSEENEIEKNEIEKKILKYRLKMLKKHGIPLNEINEIVKEYVPNIDALKKINKISIKMYSLFDKYNS